MKKTLLLLFMGMLSFSVFAQRPDWTKYEARQERYPETLYIVGYATDQNTDNMNEEKFLAQLTDYARVQVIQAIQVSIESEVKNKIHVLNGDATQEFQQSSVSLAKAEIAGLEYKTYYDMKSNTGFAMAFAKRSELISYYKEKLKSKLAEIPQKIVQAEQMLNGDDKNGALKSYYECLPIFSEIGEAQVMLVALGVKTSELHLQEVADYKTKVKLGISQLTNSDNLTLSQLAYFLAYGLHLQTGEVKNQLYVGDMTFQDTEMKSAFSKRFRQDFQSNLVKEGKYKTKEGTYAQANVKGGFYPNYFVDGTYWEESGRLKVIVKMRDTRSGKTKATAEASIATSWLEQNDIAYVPEAIKKLEEMKEIKLIAPNPKYEVKITQVAKKPLVVYATLDEEGEERIPVKYKLLASGEALTTEWSDAEGKTEAILSNAEPSTKTVVIVAELDVAAYLGLEPHSSYAAKVSATRSIPKTKIFAKILGPTAFFELRETNIYNRYMQVPVIEPKLKEALTEKGYTFTVDIDEADIMVTINAKSRKGNTVHGLYFAFVDATVSVMDLGAGVEIYKNAYNDIKGGSGNWERAAIKAYNSAADEITKAIVEEIMKKQ